MDAVEFIKAWERMCNSYNGCHECPLKDETCSLAFGGINPDIIVPIVEHWAQKQPIKTRQSVFLEQYPGIVLDAFGVVQLCPMYISATHRDSDGECKNPERLCIDCRREFWMQEVE